MKFTEQQLQRIYRRTSGYCHICHKKLAYGNYGKFGHRGAWEVDHSNCQANDGGHHGNNLFAACISCNRRKSDSTTAVARRRHNKVRAPLSRSKRKAAKFENGIAGAIVGGAVGAIFGPPGVAIGSIVGGCIAANQNPDRR
jgi:5-methylcytosine-specific restriction endonuclease McrA